MGLAVMVGLLAEVSGADTEAETWVRRDLKQINKLLRKHGLPDHVEPEHLADQPAVRGPGSFPYSFLHHLRRAQACLLSGLAVRDGEMTDDDWKLLARVADRTPTHLMNHSDCDGHYVPLDFSRPISGWPSLLARIAGGTDSVVLFGSSVRLQAELLELARPLNIELIDGRISAEAVLRIETICDAEGPLYPELLVWLTLWDACDASIRLKSLITFA